MRLIDADRIMGTGSYIHVDEDHNAYILLDDIAKLIDAQPTAYDVDKVVAELEEEKKQSAADWYFYRRNRNWHMHDVYDGKINAFTDAIKIVKGENHETKKD